MNEQVLSAIAELLDSQPPDADVSGALVAALASGDAETTVVTRTGFRPPFTNDSRVLLYSFSKTILAAALLRFVAAGLIGLNDTLDRWLPQYPVTARIKLCDVLAHVSGLPDYGRLAEYHAAVRSSALPWTADEFLARSGADGLLFEPATGWTYSNIGYMWLRDVLMQVGGGDMETVLRNEIFDPLGIVSASVPLTRDDLSSFTFGPSRYLSGGATPVAVVGNYDPGWIATGVVGSLAIDAARALRGIMETLLPSHLRDEMTKPVTRFGTEYRPWQRPAYGLGLAMELDDTQGPIYGHTGGGPGCSPTVYHFPHRDPQLTLAVITDGEDGSFAETLLLAAAAQWPQRRTR